MFAANSELETIDQLIEEYNYNEEQTSSNLVSSPQHDSASHVWNNVVNQPIEFYEVKDD